MVTTGEHKDQMTTTVLPVHIKSLARQVAESQDYKLSGWIRHLIMKDLRERGLIEDSDVMANAPAQGEASEDC